MTADRDAAEGLWIRFRDVVLAIRRLEHFNFSLDESQPPLPETWLGDLVEDNGLLGQVSRELVLRVVRSGADPVNYAILAHLPPEDVIAVAELARLTGLPRFTLLERVNDLAQVGLAVRVLERDAVGATQTTRAFCGVVDEIERRLAALIRERLPGLLTS